MIAPGNQPFRRGCPPERKHHRFSQKNLQQIEAPPREAVLSVWDFMVASELSGVDFLNRMQRNNAGRTFILRQLTNLDASKMAALEYTNIYT
jgi:hypothetical protein